MNNTDSDNNGTANYLKNVWERLYLNDLLKIFEEPYFFHLCFNSIIVSDIKSEKLKFEGKLFISCYIQEKEDK